MVVEDDTVADEANFCILGSEDVDDALKNLDWRGITYVLVLKHPCTNWGWVFIPFHGEIAYHVFDLGETIVGIK